MKRAESVVANGGNLNGGNLNGGNLNGGNLNGDDLNNTLFWASFSGAQSQSGAYFDYVSLNGSMFQGLQGTTAVSGTGFNQARFVGVLGSGAQVTLRVDSITPSTGPQGDIWLYRVSYYNSADAQWHPICRDAQGQATDAIAMNNRWDYRNGVSGGGDRIVDSSVFTFACEGAALAKCVHFGYRPWATVNGVSLAAHHQACTRLTRADYCGDGTAHTVDGQWVNVFDNLVVQADTESWSFEGEWDTAGARCFSQDHNRAHTTVTCSNPRTVSGCGDLGHFFSGATLMSETPY